MNTQVIVTDFGNCNLTATTRKALIDAQRKTVTSVGRRRRGREADHARNFIARLQAAANVIALLAWARGKTSFSI